MIISDDDIFRIIMMNNIILVVTYRIVSVGGKIGIFIEMKKKV